MHHQHLESIIKTRTASWCWWKAGKENTHIPMHRSQKWPLHRPSYLERQLKLQEFGVAGSSIAVQFGIFWVPFDSFCIMLHGLGIVPWIRKRETLKKIYKATFPHQGILPGSQPRPRKHVYTTFIPKCHHPGCRYLSGNIHCLCSSPPKPGQGLCRPAALAPLRFSLPKKT